MRKLKHDFQLFKLFIDSPIRAKKRNLAALGSQTAPGIPNQSSSPTGTIPKSGAYKRQNPSNNIHRLHQNSDSEDEEKKTYNGNSTQQM